MTDLWYEASADQDAIAREAALATAEGHMITVWPFLFEARSGRELEHRLAFAEHRLEHIAAQAGMEPDELHEMARRRFALLQEARHQRQALPEGVDPLAWAGHGGVGGGPEKPDEHDEGPDFSHGYSEIPAGAPGGPVPGVVTPVFGHPQQPGEAVAARKQLPKGMCQCGCKLSKKGKCHGCKDAPGNCSCGPDAACGGMESAGKTSARRSAAAGDYLAETPPDTGTGRGAVDLGVGEESPSLKEGRRRTAAPGSSGGGGGGAGQYSTTPAGVGSGGSSPDGVGGGGLASSTAQMPISNPGAGTQTSSTSYDLTPAQDVTAARRHQARRDPVYAQVQSVAASVAASNPHLPSSECRRIARQVVGGYLLRTGTPGDGAVNDDPGAGGSGDGQGGGGGGMSGLEEYGLGKGLLSKLPGMGGGGGSALAEGAELAAL